MLLEQLAASQKNLEAVTLALNPGPAGGEAAAELVAMAKERRNALSAEMRPLEIRSGGRVPPSHV